MRRVVFIRHAKPMSEGHAEDSLRPLSEEGRYTHLKVTEDLQDKGFFPDRIYSSPLLRAMQTAEIMAKTFSIDEVIPESSLGNSFDSDKLLSLIRKMEEGETLFLVGHAPSLADFAANLVGDNILPNGLSKSGMAIVEFRDEVDYGKATFLQSLKP